MRKDLKHIVKDIEKSQEDIVNYKMRRKKIKASGIHKILYRKEKTFIPITIFVPENPKSISTNYLVAYEILPVHSSMPCKFCKTEKKSINHPLLECNGLLNVRRMTDELLRTANSSFQKIQYSWMENISSIYLKRLWLVNINRRFGMYETLSWEEQNIMKRGLQKKSERT